MTSCLKRVLTGFWVGVFCLAGCADEGERLYYGQFDPVPKDGKTDGLGVPGIGQDADSADTAVWPVRNQWSDTDTPAARRAGLAWPADSGLDWDQKYALWVEGMGKVDNHAGRYKTFAVTNPQGKVLPAPMLECAEVAYFLRITFASFYHLPFFVEAVDEHGTRVFMGHFGWRTVSGRYKNSNLFKQWYRDYTDGDYSEGNWPQDAKLRTKKLWGSNDDPQPMLGPDAHAGTYFDELFLNKRVGHFLILFLSNFGSINLADTANTFNLAPDAVREGDVLLQRWQKRGVGHTLPIKDVYPGLTEGLLQVELVSGDMPRRQPRWDGPIASKRYFTASKAGGPGANSSGDEYAKLGGGLKRFRSAVLKNGSYINTILSTDQNNWVRHDDYEGIAVRPARFAEILEEVPPEAMRDAVLLIIESKREHLRQYPASCAARIAREEAFEELYDLMKQNFWTDREQVDRQYRKLEDYVFAELSYESSKTCCWNSSTSAMYEIVMQYNLERLQQADGCVEPVVFMNDNGYGLFADYAQSIGRGFEWVAWSEDEPCGQRGVAQDSQTEHGWTAFCSIAADIMPAQACRQDTDCDDGVECTADSCGPDLTCVSEPDDGLCQPGQTCDALQGCLGEACLDDDLENNDSQDQAGELSAGTYDSLFICPGDDDWYRVRTGVGQFTAKISFVHEDGDVDLALVDAEGRQLTRSAGSENTEKVQFDVAEDTDLYLKVYGFNNAQNSYVLTGQAPAVVE